MYDSQYKESFTDTTQSIVLKVKKKRSSWWEYMGTGKEKFSTKIAGLSRKGWSLLTMVYDQGSLGQGGYWSGAQSRGVSREKTRAMRYIFFFISCFSMVSVLFSVFSVLFISWFLSPLPCFFVVLSCCVLFNGCLYLLYCFVHVLFLCPFGTMFCPFGRILCPFSRILCTFSRILCPFGRIRRPFSRILCSLGRFFCPLGTILCLVGTIFCPFLHRQLFARPPCSSWVSSWRTPTCISWSWITGCCSTVCVAQRPPGPLWTAARMASRQRSFLLVCPTSLGSLTTDVLSLPKVSLVQRLAVRCVSLPPCIVHGLDGWNLVLLLHSG